MRKNTATCGFQSTLPARGATPDCPQPADSHGSHFNPRSPHGERHCTAPGLPRAGTFQSTLPARGATLFRALRRAYIVISIHAPRTGSDDLYLSKRDWLKTFQSTLPARGATERPKTATEKERFQSTLPARGATAKRPHKGAAGTHFNPRSPHGERPTKSSRARTRRKISIHAPRTGSDVPRCLRSSSSSYYFNPRSPHGERRSSRRRLKLSSARFQSTLPARGATGYGIFSRLHLRISIHAPRTGSDCAKLEQCVHLRISIHAPRTGSDISTST